MVEGKVYGLEKIDWVIITILKYSFQLPLQ